MTEPGQARSKLARELAKASRALTARVGFSIGAEAKCPAMLLLVLLSPDEQDLARTALEAGASGLLVELVSEGEAGISAEAIDKVGGIVKIAEGRPCGVLVRSPDNGLVERLDQLAAAGVDFVALPIQKASVALLRQSSIGKVLCIDSSVRAESLRGIGALPVDAVLLETVPSEKAGGPLTIHQLLLYRQMVELAQKPVIVAAQLKLQPEDAPFLRSLGIEAVLVRAEAATSPVETIKGLRQAIDRLPQTVAKLRIRGEEAVPSIGSSMVARTPVEEEEEEDDD